MKIIILAGGKGTRLWPMSRKKFPKQFLPLGDKTLFRQTVERCLLIEKPKNIFISTNQKYCPFVKDQLKDTKIKDKNIIIEPTAKNTGPAVLFTLKTIKRRAKKNELVFVCPSDHFITPQDKFIDTVDKAKKVAKLSYIVTFGIKPTSPATGYGYIKASGISIKKEGLETSCYQVERFTEKPLLPEAKKFLKSGNYLWNSGMFLFPINLMIEEFKQKAPNIFKNINNFKELPSAPIDKAIIEKSSKVVTIPADFSWSDVGSWKSLHQIKEKDKKGNVIIGDVLAHDVENSLIMGRHRAIACLGLKDITIVETDDVIFIAPKERSEEVKKLAKQFENKSNQQQENKPQ